MMVETERSVSPTESARVLARTQVNTAENTHPYPIERPGGGNGVRDEEKDGRRGIGDKSPPLSGAASSDNLDNDDEEEGKSITGHHRSDPLGGEAGSDSGCCAAAADPTECVRVMENTMELSTVDEFKELMYAVQMQSMRRQIVFAILQQSVGGQDDPSASSEESPQPETSLLAKWAETLRHVYDVLTDSNTSTFQRNMLAAGSESFMLNVKDEILGLEKDLHFLESLQALRDRSPSATVDECLAAVDFVEILRPYHPVSPERFDGEFNECVSFLREFVSPPTTQETNDSGQPCTIPSRLPIMITDWDGTMKDYCSQYATNLQPIYTAVSMANFAGKFTRLTAVLTAGPLRGPGILDLTALPIDGPVMFSGSWGREWWLGGKRVVHDDGISDEGIDALERFNDEMRELLTLHEYAQFGLVGSGVQRKVDRLTLGVQTVCGHVHPELSTRYQDQVRERVHRIDPFMKVLHFDPSTELEVEVVVKNNDVVWNKSHGVQRVIETVGDSLEPPGKVLICGDTSSDLPMLQHASAINPEGVMTVFVGANEGLKRRVVSLVPQRSHRCFVSCPDVIHAAMMQLVKERWRGQVHDSPTAEEPRQCRDAIETRREK